MFQIDGTKITMSRGDTGAFKVRATGYTFAENDRAIFSVKNSSGAVVLSKIYAMTDNIFRVVFHNPDTDYLPAGKYSWDVRYVVDPHYDEHGNIDDGDQVSTPKLPQELELKPVVGEV